MENINLPMGFLCIKPIGIIKGNDSIRLRGFIVNKFRNYDILHNHKIENGDDIYRYPMVQYKVVDGEAIIVFIGNNTIKLIEEIAEKINSLDFHDNPLEIEKKTIIVKDYIFGISKKMRKYKFLTPCILLNSKNYERYKNANEKEKTIILEESIVNNVIRTAKGLNFTIKERIYATQNLIEYKVKLKNKTMIGFVGEFFTNFYIPNFISIGKSCSSGFGCCVDIT